MNDKIKILFLEDNEDDAELNSLELIKAGIKFVSTRVETRDKFIQALDEFKPEIILADYSLPSFNGMEALRIMQERKLNVPFIFVTGSLGEEIAVETVKQGATDYVLKQNLSRLGLSVKRALQESEELKKRESAESALRRANERISAIIDLNIVGIVIANSSGAVIEANDYYLHMIGYTREEFKQGKVDWRAITPAEWLPADEHAIKELRERGVCTPYEKEYLRRDGIRVSVFLSDAMLPGKSEEIVAFALDITERKKAETEQARLLHILESSLNEIYIFDSVSLLFEYVNRGALHNLGYTIEAMRRMTPVDLKPEFTETSFRQILGPLISHEQKQIIFTTVHRRADGSLYPIEVHLQLVKLEEKPVFLAVILDISERKLAEVALRESEEKYRTFINATEDMAFLKDDNFTYIMINEKNAAFFGKKPEEILGKNDFFLMPHDAAVACRQSDEIALRRNNIFIGEETVGGKVYETRKFPVALKNGRTGIGGYVRDFTDLKTARDNLIHSEDMLKKAQQVAHVGSWTWNIKNNSLEWSNEMFRIFGLGKDTFTGDLGDVITRSIHPDDKPVVERANLAVERDKKPLPLEYRIVRPDGTVRTVYAEAGELILDENGNAAALTGIVQDITERKKSEEALRISESFLNNIINLSPIPMWISDEKGVLVRINKSCCDMLKISPADVMGKYNVLKDNIVEKQGLMPLVQRVFEKGEIVNFELEYDTPALKQLLLKDKAIVILETTIFPVKDISGKVTNAVTQHVDITKRKLAEKALRESERFAKNTINALDINMAILDEHGIILAVNNAWRSFNEKNNGNPARANEGVNYLEICDIAKGESSEGAVEIAAGIRAVISGAAENYRLEYPCNSPETKRWFSLRVNRFHGDGQVRVVISHTDITDRKIAEDELLFRNILLTTQQETSLDGILVIDENGKIISFNKRFIDMWGISSEAIHTKSGEDLLSSAKHLLVNPDQYSEKVMYLAEHTNETSHDEINFLDGRCFERYTAPMTGADCTYYGRVWFFHDVTDRKHSEAELQKYREHLEELVKERTDDLARERNLLRTLIDSLPDEIYAKNKDSRYIIANSHILKSFGLTNINDVIGKTDFEILPQKAAMKFYSTEHAVLLAKGQMINYEESVPAADGTLRWYSITKVPMQDEEGNITGLVGINRDITYFKESEKILEKAKVAAETANLAKSTFLSSMSHEIRTPLNAILGFSELMQGDSTLSGEHRNWLVTINRSGEHLLALINDILEISRIETGRVTFNPSSFDLHALLSDIEAMFRVKTDAKKLSLLFKYSDELPEYVVTDEGKLRQIIINLVGNAVKFTKEGGIALRANVKQEKNKMLFIAEIEDTGPGIAEKDINKLFQKFGQTETGIKEGGTGLGLAISQQYAKQMNGLITIKSEEGKGSCFTLTMEIDNSEILIKEENHKRKVIGLKPGQKQYRILIADDHADNRDLLKIMLTRIGFNTEEAENGNEVIEKFKIWSPDLILMDMQMPVMDGYEATRSIKALENGKIPIIAVTASAFHEDSQKALDAGADAYIRKPFKEHEVFECIETCLGLQYIYE